MLPRVAQARLSGAASPSLYLNNPVRLLRSPLVRGLRQVRVRASDWRLRGGEFSGTDVSSGSKRLVGELRFMVIEPSTPPFLAMNPNGRPSQPDPKRTFNAPASMYAGNLPGSARQRSLIWVNCLNNGRPMKQLAYVLPAQCEANHWRPQTAYSGSKALGLPTQTRHHFRFDTATGSDRSPPPRWPVEGWLLTSAAEEPKNPAR
jgi:hypothetical protein